jgi:hypothetical protein
MLAEERLMITNPSQVIYVKLGKKGEWEKECIYSEQPLLKLGYKPTKVQNRQ